MDHKFGLQPNRPSFRVSFEAGLFIQGDRTARDSGASAMMKMMMISSGGTALQTLRLAPSLCKPPSLQTLTRYRHGLFRGPPLLPSLLRAVSSPALQPSSSGVEDEKGIPPSLCLGFSFAAFFSMRICPSV